MVNPFCFNRCFTANSLNNSFRLKKVYTGKFWPHSTNVYLVASRAQVFAAKQKSTSDLKFAANFKIPCCIYRIFSDPRPEMSLSAAINRRSMISASSSRLARSLMAASYLSPRFLSSSSKAFTSFSIFSSSRLLRRKFLSNLATFGENDQQKIRRWQRFDRWTVTVIAHFRVHLCLCFKTSLRAKSLLCENKFDLHGNEPVGRTHFHMNGFARRIILTKRQKATRTRVRRCYNRQLYLAPYKKSTTKHCPVYFK